MNAPGWGAVIACNERWFYRDDDRIVCVYVVLVAGDVGDYAAYMGPWSREWARDHGAKLSFAEACIHFPRGLDQSKYRD